MAQEFVVVHNKAGFFGKLRSMFTDNGTVRLVGGSLDIVMDNGATMARFPVSGLEQLDWEKVVTTRNLVFRGADGSTGTVRGIPDAEGEGVISQTRDGVRRVASGFDREVAGAVKLAKQNENRVKKLVEGGNGARWIQHSEVAELAKPTPTVVVGMFGDLVRRAVSSKSWRDLDYLKGLDAKVQVEKLRASNNEAYLKRAAKAAKDLSSSLLGLGLTDEQAGAVGCMEDVTQVIAGAGSGKTAVISAKAVHLEHFNGVDPVLILVLAYNRDAAEELRRRLGLAGSHAEVHTFHAFGSNVVGEATGAKYTISKLAEDDGAYGNFIDDCLKRYLQDPARSDAVAEFLSLDGLGYYAPPSSFRTFGEYESYCSDLKLQTLNGEQVKSHAELAVANFLARQGVSYKYEARYSVRTATAQRRQYQPDFYLPEYDLWIEHFCLDEKGECPAGWSEYEDGVAWKRRIHRQNGTLLAETYDWQYRNGSLLGYLRSILDEHEVVFRPVSPGELTARFERGYSFTNAVRLLKSFLLHAKASRMNKADLQAALFAKSVDQYRGILLLSIYEWVREDYEAFLRKEESHDFQDLINDGAEAVAAGKWSRNYDYVLVDEYQDISNDRVAFLQALQGQGSRMFVVGDDWQSIYRFAGSDVGLFTRPDKALGYTERYELERTFRFNEGVAQLARSFVTANKEQSQRRARGYSEVEDRGVTVVFAPDVPRGLRYVHQDLRELGEERGKVSVKYLARYNRFRQYCRGRDFSTVHRAKGLEADYSVVMGLDGGITGFPSRQESDPLLSVAMPYLEGEGYPFAEERRLLYVAITRGRKGCYVVASSGTPSPFIRELLELQPGLRVLGEAPLPCPECGLGWLRPSGTGRNMVCSRQPACHYREPACSVCGAGYVQLDRSRSAGFCRGEGCNARLAMCPSCQSNLMAQQVGLNGVYYVCAAGKDVCANLVDPCYICREGYVDPLAGGQRNVGVCSNGVCRWEFELCSGCRKGVLIPKEGSQGRFMGCTAYRLEFRHSSRDWSPDDERRFGGVMR